MRTGAENHLLAHGCAYEIRSRVIHVIVLKYCGAQSGIFQQSDAVLLYTSDSCYIFKNSYLPLYLCSAIFFYKITKLTPEMVVLFLFSFFPRGGIFTWARKIAKSK